MKRLCIYLTYDKQNIIDEYIGYMLQELKTCISYLVVVCNESELIKGQDILEKYADEIFYRENRGYDAGGFKDALCKFIGWDKIKEYDELLLANDSFFGPFCPMQKIFDKMAGRSCDFWGLTTHKEYINKDGTRFTPEHVQSFFLVFRSKLLHSPDFREFWEAMPYYKTFGEVVEKYEKRLTGLFHSKGYNYLCYADMKPNNTDNIKNNYNQFMLICNELVQKRNFPFLKKQQIAYNTLQEQTQENIPLVLEYIKNHTNYDINLIYENIIRLMNVSDLQRKLCLHYILDDKCDDINYTDVKIAIVIIINYHSSLQYVTEYIDRLSDRYSILILSEFDILLKEYSENGYQCIMLNKQKKIIDKLTSFDLVCVIHDTDMASDHIPSFVGKSEFYNIWENLVRNTKYVAEIVHVFEENEKLGLLTQPHANFGNYFGQNGAGWNGKYEEICKAVKKYHIQCNLDYMKPPFEIVDNYWIRGNLFEILRECEADLLELLPWLWCYIAQGKGYFSGIVESKSYAQMNEINKQYYLDAICSQIREQFGMFQNFGELQQVLSERAVIDYCQRHEKVYVYGTGKVAEKYSLIIPNIEAYVVSDGQNKLQEFQSKKVLYFSEIRNNANLGLVICLDKKNQAQVVPNLLDAGIKDYFCV